MLLTPRRAAAGFLLARYAVERLMSPLIITLPPMRVRASYAIRVIDILMIAATLMLSAMLR